MGNITLDEYWCGWMDKIIRSGIRPSRADIVREGLKAVKFTLDHEFNELEDAKAHIKEMKENE